MSQSNRSPMLYKTIINPIGKRYVGVSTTKSSSRLSKALRQTTTAGGKPAPKIAILVASPRLKDLPWIRQRMKINAAIDAKISADCQLNCTPLKRRQSARNGDACSSRSSDLAAIKLRLPATMAPMTGTRGDTTVATEATVIDATFAPAAAPPTVKNIFLKLPFFISLE